MKILAVIGIILSILVIVLGVLQLTGVLKNTLIMSMPMAAVVMLIQAIEHRKNERGVAYFSIFVSIFLLVLTVWILRMK